MDEKYELEIEGNFDREELSHDTYRGGDIIFDDYGEEFQSQKVNFVGR